jgi:3-deoxy-manno-octulosonate cytidylyltransferase (CMP-KDO synthetase)
VIESPFFHLLASMSARRRIRPEDIVGIIPARWEASRYPGKPMAIINGRPLIERVVAGCRRSKRVRRWIVATDNARIAAAASLAGAEVALTPSNLKSGSDRVAYVARKMKERWVLNWQGDEWPADGRPIDLLIESLEVDATAKVGTLARPLDSREANNPNRVKVVVSRSGRALYFSRAQIPHRQGGEPTLLHLGAYLFERTVLLQFARWRATPLEQCERLEQLRMLEHDVPIHVAVSRSRTFAVDSPADARALGRHLTQKNRSIR